MATTKTKPARSSSSSKIRAGDASLRTDSDKGRQLQNGVPSSRGSTRGASVQGEKQNAKGAPQGANQGGAPRGGSRVEPSHTARRAKKDR
jgi:hypothetical protein